jgi:hypothetical protein
MSGIRRGTGPTVPARLVADVLSDDPVVPRVSADSRAELRLRGARASHEVAVEGFVEAVVGQLISFIAGGPHRDAVA